MMANADKVAAEANAAAIAEDVGIVQGASADALGIGAGAAETLADVTNDLCDMGALTGTRTSRSGKIKVILPETYREVQIEKDLEKGFDYRTITIREVHRA